MGLLNHFAFTVSNLERSVDFYCDVLGLTRPEGVNEANGSWISNVVGHDDVRMRVVFLGIQDTYLELIEYERPRGDPASNGRPWDAGNGHLALNVSDIRRTYEDLSGRGVEFISEPQLVPNGGWAGYHIAYLKDPDGIVVELVEPVGDGA